MAPPKRDNALLGVYGCYRLWVRGWSEQSERIGHSAALVGWKSGFGSLGHEPRRTLWKTSLSLYLTHNPHGASLVVFEVPQGSWRPFDCQLFTEVRIRGRRAADPDAQSPVLFLRKSLTAPILPGFSAEFTGLTQLLCSDHPILPAQSELGPFPAVRIRRLRADGLRTASSWESGPDSAEFGP